MNAEEQIPLAWTRKRSVIEIPYEVNYMHRELINLRSCLNNVPSYNRSSIQPFHGWDRGSSPLGMTVALAELAMQRIVIPRGEILYAGSSPVGH